MIIPLTEQNAKKAIKDISEGTGIPIEIVGWEHCSLHLEIPLKNGKILKFSVQDDEDDLEVNIYE